MASGTASPLSAAVVVTSLLDSPSRENPKNDVFRDAGIVSVTNDEFTEARSR